jgi:hypothetical protein
MYAICSTKKNDVMEAVKEALKRGYNDINFFQVGAKKYSRLKNNHDMVQQHISTTKLTHVLNYRTNRVHKSDCSHKGKHPFQAHIINVPASGMSRCKHCM